MCPSGGPLSLRGTSEPAQPRDARDARDDARRAHRVPNAARRARSSTPRGDSRATASPARPAPLADAASRALSLALARTAASPAAHVYILLPPAAYTLLVAALLATAGDAPLAQLARVAIRQVRSPAELLAAAAALAAVPKAAAPAAVVLCAADELAGLAGEGASAAAAGEAALPKGLRALNAALALIEGAPARPALDVVLVCAGEPAWAAAARAIVARAAAPLG